MTDREKIIERYRKEKAHLHALLERQRLRPYVTAIHDEINRQQGFLSGIQEVMDLMAENEQLSIGEVITMNTRKP